MVAGEAMSVAFCWGTGIERKSGHTALCIREQGIQIETWEWIRLSILLNSEH